MPYYRDNFWIAPLEWQVMFTDSTQFIEKVVSIGGDTTHLDDLFALLEMRYMYAKTRYIEEEAFILGLQRELYLYWPIYLKQKEVMDQVFALTLEDVMRVSHNLTNIVNTNDGSAVDADTLAIEDLSTTQTNSLSRQGKLAALLTQYESARMDYIRGLYSKTDQLFQKILADTPTYLYEQEDVPTVDWTVEEVLEWLASIGY